MSRSSSRDGAIRVRVDPKLADLVPRFLQSLAHYVIVMKDALDHGDFETVKGLAHGMKGAGGSYGFPAITDIGAALEQAAESTDTEASREWVDKLAAYLDRVEVVS